MPPVPPAQQYNAPLPRGPHDHPTRPHGQASQQAAHQHRDRRVVATPHQRHGDRGCSDDDERGCALPVFVRYRDIKASGIAASWQQLNRLIDEANFPRGIMLSPNIRAWKVDDIRAWLEARPSERKGVPLNRYQRQQALT
jgi:predicted DNA-binding transcriptional regulator AlpA